MSSAGQPQSREHAADALSQTAVPSISETWPKSQAGLQVSEDEYWRRYYNHREFNYEWNNGLLEEKPSAKFRSVRQYQWFLYLLQLYQQRDRQFQLLNLKIGFRMTLAEKTTIRKPDLFIVLDDNPTPIDEDDDAYRGICDEYAEAGVREYYILDCEGRYTTFYRSVRDPQTGKRTFALLPIGADGVVRSAVMPGFQFRLRDLYRLPPLEELVEDEVYRGYVWLAYQAQQQRAAQAEAEAAAERLRAEQERQRADEAERRTEQERRLAQEADKSAEQERRLAQEADKRAEAAHALAHQYAAQLRALGLLLPEEPAP